ncbi:MAG: hypothetical protein HYX53_04945 [Chloroflexi bacterium]|nr:hypothetical protein [Chloroflexota bacterium]
MAELKDTAEQFAKDLVAQNIAGLMMAFTPAGMGKAMALQAQRAAAGTPAPTTGFEVVVQGQEGDDHLIDIIMKSADGEGIIATRWKDVAGAWKVDDMAMKEA